MWSFAGGQNENEDESGKTPKRQNYSMESYERNFLDVYLLELIVRLSQNPGILKVKVPFPKLNRSKSRCVVMNALHICLA
jgi:hypothetical protein